MKHPFSCTVPFLLALLMLSFYGCGQATAGALPHDVYDPSGGTDGNAEDSGIAATHEYGEPGFIIHNEPPLICNLSYPVLGVQPADLEIAEWAQKSYEAALAAIPADANAPGDFAGSYSTFLVQDRYVGIEQTCLLNHSELSHPIEWIKTFNVDLASGQIITPAALFPEAKHPEIFILMKKYLLSHGLSLSPLLDEMDATWLSAPVLKAGGIELILAQGLFLPDDMGTQRVFLTYEELGHSLALSPDDARTPGIDPDRPMVALTFDDGPSPITAQILDVLEQYDARATFCVVGNRINAYSGIVTRTVEQGSEIISHSWAHGNLSKMAEEDIVRDLKDANDLIFEYTGYFPKMVRIPYGFVNEKVLSAVKELDMFVLDWSIDTLDWHTKDADKVYSEIMDSVKDGSIILCHDLYASTAEAMEQVIPALIEQGYQLVTMSELLYYSGESPEPGTFYDRQ